MCGDPTSCSLLPPSPAPLHPPASDWDCLIPIIPRPHRQQGPYYCSVIFTHPLISETPATPQCHTPSDSLARPTFLVRTPTFLPPRRRAQGRLDVLPLTFQATLRSPCPCLSPTPQLEEYGFESTKGAEEEAIDSENAS